MRYPQEKIMTVAQARAWRRQCQQDGRTVVFTNGCFDILHRGHAEYLGRARALGDTLVVAMNRDATVRALKGPGRPVNREDDRAFLLAALEAVDVVVLFGTRTVTPTLTAIRPDVYVKGGDYTLDTIPPDEAAAVREIGARAEFLPFVDGLSTTKLIHRIHAGKTAS